MNVGDSCGWLEYIANGSNADFFCLVPGDESQLLLPRLVVGEVTRRRLALKQKHAIKPSLKVMGWLQRVDLKLAQLVQAAQAASTHKLVMANAIIWQNAQGQQALLYTRDVDLKGLPGVVYHAEPVPGVHW